MLRRVALLLSILAWAGALAQESGAPAHRERSAGGRISWIFSDDLDLVGDLYADVPFAVGDQGGLFLSASTRTAIRKATSLTFDVRDLEYTVEAGGRHDLTSRLSLAGLAGQWGKSRADSDGSLFVRYLAVALEPARLNRRARLDGRLCLGAVVDEHALDADAIARGSLLFRVPRERYALGAEVRVDTLLGGADSGVDLQAGPRLDLFLTGPTVASFFLDYLHASSALGLQTSGVMLGFEYTDAPSGGAERTPPSVTGSLSAGGGDDGRGSARLDLQILSPPFSARAARVAGGFDLNVLTSRDIDELWYVYRVGVELEAGGALIAAEFEHRSNHRLADPGAAVTSVNLLQLGIETTGWSHAPARRRGAFDARARLGVFLDTDFGDSGDVHASGAARYTLPWGPGSVATFLFAAVEDGQVGRRSYGAGIGLPADTEVRLEYLRDDQFYGADKSAVLLTGSLRF